MDAFVGSSTARAPSRFSEKKSFFSAFHGLTPAWRSRYSYVQSNAKIRVRPLSVLCWTAFGPVAARRQRSDRARALRFDQDTIGTVHRRQQRLLPAPARTRQLSARI